jgi:hypothetical protein
VWSENLEGRDHLKDLGVDGIILTWFLRNRESLRTAFIQFRIWTSGGIL